jgi:hypothetical protein
MKTEEIQNGKGRNRKENGWKLLFFLELHISHITYNRRQESESS